MPRPKSLVLDLADADADYFAAAATGASITLAQTATPDGLAHQLNFTSTANLSALTFTVTGTDADGRTITEAVTGPNNTTVESASYFKTVTSIVPSATLGANTVNIGFVDEAVSQTYPLNWRDNDAALRLEIEGTADATVQQTFDDVQDADTFSAQADYEWSDHDDTDLVTATASANSNFDFMPRACRVRIASYSSGAKVTLHIIESQS